MKNILKFLGIIALAAVIGFPMVSCGDDGIVSVIGGVLELTNLDKYNGKYAVAWGKNDTVVALSVNKQNGLQVSKGSVILSVWNVGDDGIPISEYKGSDKMLVRVIFSDSPSVNFADGSDEGDGGWAGVVFKKGAGIGVFTDKFSEINNLPDINNGVLTLTGLDQYEGKYVAAFGGVEGASLRLAAAKNVNAQTRNGKGVKISKGKAILNVWNAVGDDQSGYTLTDYNGNDNNVKFDVSIFDNAAMNFGEDFDSNKKGIALATFQKGIGAGYFGLPEIGNPSPPPGSGGTSINITVSSTSLVGTWTGDSTNGTLSFTTDKISTTDTATKASAFIAAINRANSTNTVTINGTGTSGTISKLVDDFASVNLYSWKIDNGTTLTITDNIYGTTAFTGTKQ